MSLRIYNTLTQKKEEFKPVEPGNVKIYLCGPTVYGFVHVGNMLGAIFFNFVRNFFELEGYKVKFVYNYTDVDDKIIDTAKKQGISPDELATKFIHEFEKDFDLLGLKKADVNPRVTTHMPEIIEMISAIIKNGHAYVVDGEVFYSIKSNPQYGKLSHKNIDELQAGARVEIGVKKENPLDFSLWKPAKPGEPFWESPWGKGRPGWHIECSAMAKKHLGTTFDLHGGGIDLIFPHHENEIAQSEGANNAPFVNCWMHNNFINFGKAKMSKSLGNIVTARGFLEKYNGEVLKFMMLSSHYRSPSDFSEAAVTHAISGLARVYSSLARATRWVKKCKDGGFAADPKGKVLDPAGFGKICEGVWEKVKAAGRDDFNTPEVLAEIFNVVRSYNNLLKPGIKPSQELANSSALLIERVTGIGKLLALYQDEPTEFLIKLDNLLLQDKGLERAAIQSKVDQRLKARAQKDFKTSDTIRDELKSMGVEVRDTPEGSEWEVIK